MLKDQNFDELETKNLNVTVVCPEEVFNSLDHLSNEVIKNDKPLVASVTQITPDAKVKITFNTTNLIVPDNFTTNGTSGYE